MADFKKLVRYPPYSSEQYRILNMIKIKKLRFAYISMPAEIKLLKEQNR